MQELRQSTAVNVMLGPFVDDTDGKTTEEALTLSQADLQLSKNGGTAAQKNDTNSATHRYGGNYSVPLNATDTNTLGCLELMCKESGALPVRRSFMVVTQNYWDSKYGTDKLQVDVTQIAGVAQTGNDVGADVDAILADTDELQTNQGNWVTATTVALNAQGKADVNAEVDAALADYDPPTKAELDAAESNIRGADSDTLKTISDQVDGLNDPSASAIADAVWDEAIADHTTSTTFGGKNQKVVPSETLADYKADVSSLAVEANVETHVTNSLNSYDPPTRTELTSDKDEIIADTQDIQSRIPAALSSGGNIKADVLAISGSTDAADKLEASAETIVTGAAVAGTLSTTQMTTDLTEATDDHYNGRIIIWTSGVLKDQATDVTDYDGATKKLTYTATTEAPSEGDTFVLV
ncbi:MAG: hypothetical protein B5M48_03825 [Candidatus Omnitrophica bacterium 4484_213]|nr:MAG: hypothetical protein B5M48_03825 [Candidatus Omnitrophica bacterium 4484_213]